MGWGIDIFSGPKKATANKGKFYSGIPLNRLEELKTGSSLKHRPVSNFYDFAGGFGNCRLEGGVGFKGGKKTRSLVENDIKNTFQMREIGYWIHFWVQDRQWLLLIK